MKMLLNKRALFLFPEPTPKIVPLAAAALLKPSFFRVASGLGCRTAPVCDAPSSSFSLKSRPAFNKQDGFPVVRSRNPVPKYQSGSQRVTYQHLLFTTQDFIGSGNSVSAGKIGAARAGLAGHHANAFFVGFGQGQAAHGGFGFLLDALFGFGSAIVVGQ